jgi:hypothetical protein
MPNVRLAASSHTSDGAEATPLLAWVGMCGVARDSAMRIPRPALSNGSAPFIALRRAAGADEALDECKKSRLWDHISVFESRIGLAPLWREVGKLISIKAARTIAPQFMLDGA